MVRPAAAVSGAFLAASLVIAANAAECVQGTSTTAIVAAATSASTLRLENGQTVVLAGIAPPQSGPVPDEAWPPREAARAELDRLVTGKSVTVVSGGRRTNRYGDLAGHVFLTTPANSERIWIEGELIAAGLARAAALDGTESCLEDMLALESAARTDKRGNWGSGIFADRDAGDVYALKRLHDTFQTVTGIVERVEDGYGVRALILTAADPNGPPAKPGAAGRESLRAEVPAPSGRSRRASHASGFEGLIGRRVRVRGWLQGGARPRIPLADVRLIETVDEETPLAEPK